MTLPFETTFERCLLTSCLCFLASAFPLNIRVVITLTNRLIEGPISVLPPCNRMSLAVRNPVFVVIMREITVPVDHASGSHMWYTSRHSFCACCRAVFHDRRNSVQHCNLSPSTLRWLSSTHQTTDSIDLETRLFFGLLCVNM